jgi:hypothetical protein
MKIPGIIEKMTVSVFNILLLHLTLGVLDSCGGDEVEELRVMYYSPAKLETSAHPIDRTANFVVPKGVRPTFAGLALG